MPLTTDFSVSPYNDDYSEAKDFNKILFQPGVAVQVRELNQLQSMFQKQVERMGNNLFKRGALIDGCNFSFFNNYCYAKLLDNTVADGIAAPAAYVNLYAKNGANLQAYIVNYLDGFEASDPNLKTLFLNYVNSGNTFTANAFSPSDVLTIYHPANKLFKIVVDAGASLFSNSDTVVISPTISVNTTTGVFSNGDYLYQPSTGANAQIVGVALDPNNNNQILTLAPRTSDLANASVNSVAWTFTRLEDVRNDGNTAIGNIFKVFGSGAGARAITTGTGRVSNIVMTDYGSGFDYIPYVTIKSSNNAAGIAALSLTPRNYLTKVTVSSSGSAVGNGYAFGISDGVIYQKGYFLRVDSQVVIVNNYNSSPNNVCVGFDTIEEIITYNEDTSLLDNALETENETAPGANRLRLTPALVVTNTDIAQSNGEFFSLVEWNDGNPYKQHTTTAYDKIGDAMAERTADSSGDFVLDTFLVTTDSVANTQQEGLVYTAVVDPGSAYVSGYKVTTNRNFRIDVAKGLDTVVTNNHFTSINYDHYIKIKEVGGLFQFSTGDTIDLYNTAKGFISNTSLITTANTTPQGTKIGTARIRSMRWDSGIPGANSAVYRLYMFDVAMLSGFNFRDVKSVYYNGTYKGIADVVLTLDATTNANVAQIVGANNNQLIFKLGMESIRNSNNTTYTYRTIDQTLATANTGLLTKSIASSPNEFYPYSGALTNTQMQDLYVVPMGNNLIQYAALTGTVSVNATVANVIGTSTTFISDIAAGDWVYILDGANSTIQRVASVTNSTLLALESNCTIVSSSAAIRRAFPKNIPVPFGNRSGLSANVDANGNILTLNFGFSLAGSVTVNTALGVNIQRTGVTSTAKTAHRKVYVKIKCSNALNTTAGPYCLGVPDAFRLRNVYWGNSSVDATYPDVVNEYYIDNKYKGNYLDLSHLYLRPTSGFTPSSGDYLLVKFDYMTRADDGYFDTVSYLGTSNSAQIANLDSLPLANLSSAVASFEVPEMYTDRGDYYDMLNCFDFRPAVSNTAAPNATAGSAPVNPDNTKSFGNTADPTNDKKFPLPDSLCQSNIEQYMGRIDDVIVGHDGIIAVIKGTPSADPTKRVEPNLPNDCMKLQTIKVPAYPNIARNLNSQLAELISTRMVSSVATTQRLSDHTIYPIFDSNLAALAGQPLGYSMKKVGGLERRIKNLEYMAGLSALETDIVNRIIPSSTDGTLNRFKFGFFADDFSTWINNDLRDPQYAAEIETGPKSTTIQVGNTLPQEASNLLVPPKFRWVVPHVAPSHQMYIDYVVITQNNATESPPVCNLAPIVNTAGVTVANNLQFSYFDWGRAPTDPIPTTFRTAAVANYTAGDIDTVTMANASGNCVLYYQTQNDPFMSVYQGNTLLVTSANAVQLTDDDVNFMYTNPYTEGFWTLQTAKAARNNFWKDQNGFINYSGAIHFSHDPALGLNYTIITTGFAGVNQHWPFQSLLVYPAQLIHITQIVDPCQGTSPTVFNGTMQATKQITSNITQVTDIGWSTTSSWKTSKYYNTDSIILQCTGLKPSTKHSLFIDGREQIANVKPYGGNLGDNLIAQADGKLQVTWYPDQAWTNLIDQAIKGLDIRTPDNAKTSGTLHSYAGGWQNDGPSPLLKDEAKYTVPWTLFEMRASGSCAYSLVSLLSPHLVLT